MLYIVFISRQLYLRFVTQTSIFLQFCTLRRPFYTFDSITLQDTNFRYLILNIEIILILNIKSIRLLSNVSSVYSLELVILLQILVKILIGYQGSSIFYKYEFKNTIGYQGS